MILKVVYSLCVSNEMMLEFSPGSRGHRKRLSCFITTFRGASYGSMVNPTSSSHGLIPGITVRACDPEGGALGSKSSPCECVTPRRDLT